MKTAPNKCPKCGSGWIANTIRRDKYACWDCGADIEPVESSDSPAKEQVQ